MMRSDVHVCAPAGVLILAEPVFDVHWEHYRVAAAPTASLLRFLDVAHPLSITRRLLSRLFAHFKTIDEYVSDTGGLDETVQLLRAHVRKRACAE